MTISEAFSIFIREEYAKGNSKQTLDYYNYNIPKFIEYCEMIGIDKVETLNNEVFEEYKIFLLSTNKKSRKITLQTYSRAIKVFLNWLNSGGYLTEDIGKLSLIKAEIPNIVILSDAEVQILLNCFDNSFYGIRNKLIVLLMVDSGLRRGEVVSLQRNNINILNRTMLVTGKGDKERIVPFGEETTKHIRIYSNLINPFEKFFFQKQNGEPITDNTIKMFFQHLKEESGISRLYPHLLRHTFATNYILYGGDVEELRILLGHTSITMTQKYVHLAAQQRILQQRYHSHIDKLICKFDDIDAKDLYATNF